jgi:hypothetical protein
MCKNYDIFRRSMRYSLSSLWQKIISTFRAGSASPKTLADYNREALVKQGADQFRKLIEKGLSVPVNLV